jgi:CIC family chloride channel protein
LDIQLKADMLRRLPSKRFAVPAMNREMPPEPRSAAVRLWSHIVAALARARAWLGDHAPNESQHLFGLTLVVGVVCGLVAVAFHLSIRAAEGLLIDRALNAPGSSWMVWTIVTPTLGGLFAGAALTWVVPGARGSGVPQVKQAFATEGGRVRFRDALGKFVLGSIQIGSGASLGREGPTVQICAGAASLLARATALAPRNMRRLTPVGVAAGIAAAFNAPIAAVTFTIEEIVGTLDQAVLSGVVVAAALAAVIERSILGVHPVIQVDQAYGLDHTSSLLLYALLGVAASVVSVAFTDGLLGLRLWFRSVRAVPSWAHPAIGGLVTGVLAVGMLRFMGTTGITGGGYATLGRALAGQLSVRVLIALCVVKMVATVFSYSSGGAGGIFAPSLFIGAMLGGAAGHLDVYLLGHESSQVGAFALVGMGAVFAGVVRAPITSVLIIFEMTGGYGLVLPLMLANMTSYILARRLRPVPIYDALLAQDGVVLPHASLVPQVATATRTPLPTTEARHGNAPIVPPATRVADLALRLLDGDTEAFLVRHDDGSFSGVLAEQVSELARDADLANILIAADVVHPAATVDPGADLGQLAALLQREQTEIAVVLDRETGAPCGVVTRTAVARAYLDWHTRRARATDDAENARRDRERRQKTP